VVIEQMFGYSFEKPVRHMKEYLTVLRAVFADRNVSFKGESLSAMAPSTVAVEVPSPRILVAALGTQMLRLTGRLAEGTITWMTGPATLAEHTVPTLKSATAEAGRPEAFRVVAGLPVCVTDDADAAKERGSQVFAIYGQLPSYRAMLDREGADGPADVALVGDEKTVADGRLHRQRLGGEHERVSGIRRDDRCAQFDAVDVVPRDGDRGQRVDAEDLRQPVRAEALLACFGDELHQVVDPTGALAGLTPEDPDAHGAARYPRAGVERQPCAYL